MKNKNLVLDVKGEIALITINRPDKLNALNLETLEEMEAGFLELKSNPEIAVIIITGNGEKAFVAGADISELNRLDMISGKEFAERGQSVFNLIENMNKPVIAAVNGLALGGGCELALACHIRTASENAKFGQPELNLGIIPGFGGTQRLTRLINSGRALEYILTGAMIDSSEALRIGLVNNVFPKSELLNQTLQLGQKIASKPAHAVKSAIEAVKKAEQLTLREGLSFEAGLFAICCGTEDFKEGTAAFLEKRTPKFKNK